MFSFTHLAIVFIIALLVFGPEKLPEIARTIGKALADFRRASTDFRRVVEQEFAEIERQTREKEERARQKALEASTAAPVPQATGAVAADAPTRGAGEVPAHDAPAPAESAAAGYPDTAGPSSAQAPATTPVNPADGHAA